MISSWRSAWEQPELPFFYVLLAAGHTALLRESQVAGASLLAHTAWATAADLGDGLAKGLGDDAPAGLVGDLEQAFGPMELRRDHDELVALLKRQFS